MRLFLENAAWNHVFERGFPSRLLRLFCLFSRLLLFHVFEDWNPGSDGRAILPPPDIILGGSDFVKAVHIPVFHGRHSGFAPEDAVKVCALAKPATA